MDLSDFVATSIQQIILGVQEAQKLTIATNAVINPNYYHPGEGTNRDVSKVHFNIALTNSESTDEKKGIGVLFGGVGLGAQNQTGEQQESATNLSFSVSVLLPSIEKKEPLTPDIEKKPL